jgi:hypothetical protein
MRYRLIWCVFLISALTYGQEKTDILKESFGFTEQTPHSIDFKKLIQGCPKINCIPSIDHPVFVKTDQATFLQDNDRVLGIFHNGIAKAYPVKIMAWHEVVNDTFEKAPVVISFCPLCGSGMAYESVLNGKSVTFGVSGMLYNSNLIMYDRETKSLWEQIEGKSIAGDSNGKFLTGIPVAHSSWKIWREEHPETLVLSTQTGMRRDYSKNPYLEYETSLYIRFPIEHQSKLLEPKAWVYGIEINGKAQAFSESWIQDKKKAVVKIAKKKLEFTYHENGTVTAKDVKTGKTYTTRRMFWFVWAAFHPKTKLKGASTKGFLNTGTTREQQKRKAQARR